MRYADFKKLDAIRRDHVAAGFNHWMILGAEIAGPAKLKVGGHHRLIRVYNPELRSYGTMNYDMSCIESIDDKAYSRAWIFCLRAHNFITTSMQSMATLLRTETSN